jgi:hypothetical protein
MAACQVVYQNEVDPKPGGRAVRASWRPARMPCASLKSEGLLARLIPSLIDWGSSNQQTRPQVGSGMRQWASPEGS